VVHLRLGFRSGIAVAATLLHYAQAHRVGSPGGYGALVVGALSVGFLAWLGGYFSSISSRLAKAITAGLGVAAATATVLLATLIWAYGS
jgi:hypothetical protein